MAVVQSVGMVPCFSEAWNNIVNVGVSSSAIVLVYWLVSGLAQLLCALSCLLNALTVGRMFSF